jgi:hypothetical protein
MFLMHSFSLSFSVASVIYSIYFTNFTLETGFAMHSYLKYMHIRRLFYWNSFSNDASVVGPSTSWHDCHIWQ